MISHKASSEKRLSLYKNFATEKKGEKKPDHVTTEKNNEILRVVYLLTLLCGLCDIIRAHFEHNRLVEHPANNT